MRKKCNGRNVLQGRKKQIGMAWSRLPIFAKEAIKSLNYQGRHQGAIVYLLHRALLKLCWMLEMWTSIRRCFEWLWITRFWLQLGQIIWGVGTNKRRQVTIFFKMWKLGSKVLDLLEHLIKKMEAASNNY
jgi:hypothetical protein